MTLMVIVATKNGYATYITTLSSYVTYITTLFD